MGQRKIHLPRGNRSHYFKRWFHFMGRERHGYLTVSFGRKSESLRDVILVDYANDLVPEELKEKFSLYEKDLNQKSDGGVIGSAKKFLVENSAGSKFYSSHIRIVVHKFGPVPAFYLDESIDVEINGEIVSVDVCCYLNPEGHDFVGTETGIENTRHKNLEAFIKCIEISPELLFFRYFEDVAWRFEDISKFGNSSANLVWLKEIETILGASISTKLKVMKPSSKTLKGTVTEWDVWKTATSFSQNTALSKEFFEKNPELTLYVTSFRSICLYLVNCTYQLLGLHSRRGEYYKRIKRDIGRFNIYFKRDVLESAFEKYPRFHELYDFFNALHNKQEDDLYAEYIDTTWLSMLINYMRHIYWTQKEIGNPIFPKFFLSYIHDDEVSESTSKAIEDELNKRPLETLRIDGSDRDIKFFERIKSSIWLADRLLAVGAVSPQDKVTGSKKGYRWIVSEGEHAVNQGKDAVFYLQQGKTMDDYKNEIFSSDWSPLVNSRRKDKEKREEIFLDSWSKVKHTFFSYSETNLDQRVIASLDSQEMEVTLKRARALLTGWLGLFEPYSIYVFSKIFRMFKEREYVKVRDIIEHIEPSKGDIEIELKGIFYKYQPVEDAISSAISYLRDNSRTITIEGTHHYLIQGKVKRSHFIGSDIYNVARIVFPKNIGNKLDAELGACFEKAYYRKIVTS